MAMSKGRVVGINGNMVSVEVDGDVTLNEVAYILLGETRVKSEVIRIRGDIVSMQAFEMTGGIGVGDAVEFTGEMLSVELGPGLLGRSMTVFRIHCLSWQRNAVSSLREVYTYRLFQGRNGISPPL